MRRNRILITVALALIIIGCFSPASDEIVHFDNQSWNINTSKFIENKCALLLDDSLKLGKIITPVKYNGSAYYTFRDYFESKTKNRKQLISYLEEHNKGYQDIHILESYSRDKGKILVLVNDKELLSFNTSNHGLKMIDSKKAKTSDKLFSPLKKDERDCFSEYTSIPQFLRIFSKYDVELKSITPYQVSMYD